MIVTEQKPGHLEVIGETAAKLLLFQKGWNPYSRFLDVDKVDLILRRSQKNKTEYREIQVKYRRLFEHNRDRWDGKLFSATAWYNAALDEFKAHRPGFFILFVFGYPDRRIEKDVLIFPSSEFHEIIKKSPPIKEGNKRVLYISKARASTEWYVWLTRRKFSQINHITCQDVTKYLNNFTLLE
jgi:hypothetical protein